MGSPEASSGTSRVYVDMVGDLFHAGHVALLRAARTHGDWLVVGVLSDETAAAYKRRPITSLAERVAVIEACRYVDEVVVDAPFQVDEEFLVEHDIALVVHGDDLSPQDAEAVYGAFAATGKLEYVRRTLGVSTTDLIRRVLDAKAAGNLESPRGDPPAAESERRRDAQCGRLMAVESTHLSTVVDRPSEAVYDFVAQPANLPRWAGGLARTTVEQVDGLWVADSPMGRVTVSFAEYNGFGVLDHVVTLPSGESVYNPLRVIPYGDAAEVVFTLRPRPGMTGEEFTQDADAVRADLESLKRVLEER